MNNSKNSLLNNRLASDEQSNKTITASSDTESREDGSKGRIVRKRSYLSWKTLFLLFLVFRILAHFVSDTSILFAPLSLLWGICLAMAIVALITNFLSPKKSIK